MIAVVGIELPLFEWQPTDDNDSKSCLNLFEPKAPSRRDQPSHPCAFLKLRLKNMYPLTQRYATLQIFSGYSYTRDRILHAENARRLSPRRSLAFLEDRVKARIAYLTLSYLRKLINLYRRVNLVENPEKRWEEYSLPHVVQEL